MKISFPRMGDYHIPIAKLFSQLLPAATIAPAPPITQKTAVLGGRYSPDFICEPFKYNLGNFIEALEDGATHLVQSGTGCRYGYYGELQEQILRDLGYDFTFLCFSRDRLRPKIIKEQLRNLESPLSTRQMIYALWLAVECVRAIDSLAALVREEAGLSQDPGAMQRLYQQFLQALSEAKTISCVRTLRRHFEKALRAVPRKPGLLRVGIVGDLYTVMEPNSNCRVEEKLIKRGISIARRMSVSFLLFGLPVWMRMRATGEYLRYPIGANGLDSVGQTLQYAKAGYDGVLHLKSFGCAPELSAVPIMQKIGKEFAMPVMHLSFDTHLSETGIETRLDAFVDMMEMRKQCENAV